MLIVLDNQYPQHLEGRPRHTRYDPRPYANRGARPRAVQPGREASEMDVTGRNCYRRLSSSGYQPVYEFTMEK